MKKLLFTLLFALPVMAVAQVTNNISASATIAQTLTVVPGGGNTQNLTFGTIDNSDNAVTISEDDGVLTGNLTSSAVRGMVAVSGAIAPVIFEFSGGASVTLTGETNNAVSIPVSLTFATANTTAATTGATVTLTSNRLPAVTPGGTGNDEAKVFVGGTIAGGDKDGIEAQTYSGTINISILYN